MRLIRTALRNKLVSCKSIDAAFFDKKADAVTHKERQWTAVQSASGSSTPTAWQAPSMRSAVTNSFAGLAISEKSKAKPRPASPALSNRSDGSSKNVDIIGNGYHRAPSAVIVSGEAVSRDVAENWEDEA
jgi:hypothetical protein